MLHPVRSLLLVLTFGLLLPACGGSGGDGDGGGGPPGGDDLPPTLEVIAPNRPSALIPGDPLRVEFRADDDRGATVRIYLDGDGNPETTGDRIPLHQGPDSAGLPRELVVPTDGVPIGSYALLAEADDGVNPATIAPGTAVLMYPGHAGVAAPRSNAYGTVTGYAALSIGEAEDGGTSLNNDGRADDGVVAFLDLATGVLQSSALSIDVTSQGPAGTPRILDPILGTLAWDLLEADEAKVLNGDMDMVDPMVAVVTPALSPIPTIAALGSMRLVPSKSQVIRFGILREPANGADVNGDRDLLDNVYASIDLAGKAIPYVETPATGSPFAASTTAFPNAFLIDEAIQGPGNLGVDYRRDGDTVDVLLAVVNQFGNTLGLAGADFARVPMKRPGNVDRNAAFDTSSLGHVAYYIDEATTGAGPLNGDGDATDFIPAIYDYTTKAESLPGIALNAGGAARFCFCAGSVCVYTASDEGPFDRNGDGDMLDAEVLHWTDAVASPTLANVVPSGTTGLRGIALDGGSAARLTGSWVGAVVSEFANGTDLNGDGDQLDQVFFLLEIGSAPVRVFNTGLVTLPTGAIPLGTIPATGIGGDDGVLIQCAESANGDLNGDLDTNDTLMFFLPYLAPHKPIPLPDTGVLHAANRGEVIAVTAEEQLTGVDLNGDGDAFDVLFRTFDLEGNILEPGRLAGRTSIPASSNGSSWVYLREESIEGRDLNGDGDLIDVVYGIWLR